ncbi:MAG: hypothetical protein FWB83_07820, partial [Treponema sp.]|nr:hypothetical protein [Treponema sp.]
MAYNKTVWKARKGSNLNRHRKEHETERTIDLFNEPSAVTEPGTPFSTQNMNHIEDGIYEAHEMIAAEEQQRKTSDNNLQTALADETANRAAAINNEAQARQQSVSGINEKIPNQASATNQLADKDFVNSSINNAAAFLITPTAEGVYHWPSFAALQAGPWFSGGNPRAPSQNDYAFFTNIDLEIGETGSEWRALFSAGIWTPGIKINNTPFTAAQLAAINSGITQ